VDRFGSTRALDTHDNLSVCAGHYEPEHSSDEAARQSGSAHAIEGEIVDDEPSVQMLITEVLTELGYTAIEAADGTSALRVLQSDTRIDFLLPTSVYQAERPAAGRFWKSCTS
jgi:hypothetical protein